MAERFLRSGSTVVVTGRRANALQEAKSKLPGQRGDFVVAVKIKFPTSLTADQKKKLKEIL